MGLWLAITLLSLAIVGLVAWPALRRRGGADSGAEFDIAVYRDQLRELELEQARGLIEPEQARTAKLEIERRILRAAAREDTPAEEPSRDHPRLAVALVALAPVAAILAYLSVGSPGVPDQPLAARKAAESNAAERLAEIESRLQTLKERLEAEPGDVEGWTMLARSYGMLRRHGEAAQAWARLGELQPDNAEAHSAEGEALVMEAGGRVVPAAREAFARAIAADPEDARARYFIAMAAAEDGDFRTALEGWQALLASTPDDAGWREVLRRRILDMARLLELAPETVLADVTPEEIEALQADSPEARAARLDADIVALRGQLAAEPMNARGWMILARAEAARGNVDAASAAIDEARRLFEDAPFVLQQITAVAREIGLEAAPGPGEEDIAAAAAMSEAEQKEMIAGMVDGLAARLADEPADLEGWLMLIRSYAVLERTEDARRAVAAAREAFASGDARQMIDRLAASLDLGADPS